MKRETNNKDMCVFWNEIFVKSLFEKVLKKDDFSWSNLLQFIEKFFLNAFIRFGKFMFKIVKTCSKRTLKIV